MLLAQEENVCWQAEEWGWEVMKQTLTFSTSQMQTPG